jgi:DNA polymerase III delta subunit
MAAPTRKKTGGTGGGAYAPDPAHRIVALVGEEELLRSLHTRKIRETLAASLGEMQEFRFSAREVEVADILDECRSFGLLQQHKFIVVDDADWLLRGAGGDKDEDEDAPAQRRAILGRYAAAPADDATLILRCGSWGNEKKVRTAIEKIGAVIKCETPSESSAVSWVGARARETHETPIDRDAAQDLVNRVGCSLGPLDAAISKLSAIARSRGATSIDAAIVREVIEPTREEAAWEIQKELLSGDASRAVHGFRSAIGPWGHPPEFVAWVMIDLAQKLHAASSLIEQRQNPGQIRKSLRLFGSGADPTIRAAQNAGTSVSADLLRESVESMRRVRSGAGETTRALETLAIRFARVASPTADTHRGR